MNNKFIVDIQLAVRALGGYPSLLQHGIFNRGLRGRWVSCQRKALKCDDGTSSPYSLTYILKNKILIKLGWTLSELIAYIHRTSWNDTNESASV